MSAVETVVGYAVRGLPVIPLWWPTDVDTCACREGADCGSPGKHPHTFAPNGLHDASLDGHTAGPWLARYADDLGHATDTCWALGPMVSTGKGSHLYYAPTALANGSRIAKVDGFDWRGRNGYVVAPPSRHHTGRTYEWHPDCGPDLAIPAAPDFLVDLVANKTDRRIGRDPVTTAPTRSEPVDGQWSAGGLIARVATAQSGERNDVLVWAAHRVGWAVNQRRVDERRALGVLEELAIAAERAGLGQHEVEQTIRSGYGAGKAGQRGQAA